MKRDERKNEKKKERKGRDDAPRTRTRNEKRCAVCMYVDVWSCADTIRDGDSLSRRVSLSPPQGSLAFTVRRFTATTARASSARRDS